MWRRALSPAAVAALLLTLAVTFIFRYSDLDLRLQALAFRPTEPHWPYADRQPWPLLHDVGTWPGLLLAIGATIVLGASFASDRLARWRFASAYIFVLMALGPGLVTNLLGKQLCGRPRPSDVVQFGGSFPFHRPFDLGTPGRGFSFLCGHCSMGFLFYAFAFLFRGWKRWGAFAFATASGFIIGVGRVVQGAHFPSDVVLDGTIMFTLAAVLSPVAARQPSDMRLTRSQAVLATTAVVVLMIVAFLFSTPVRKEASYTWPRASSTVVLDVDRGDITIAFHPRSEPLRIETLVTGFGFPGADTRRRVTANGLVQRLHGAYWEVHGQYAMTTTAAGVSRIIARTKDGAIVVSLHGLDRPVRVAGAHLMRSGAGEPLTIVAEANRVRVIE
jgi:membrane-associated PAP2 superfamily phosphatase